MQLPACLGGSLITLERAKEGKMCRRGELDKCGNEVGTHSQKEKANFGADHLGVGTLVKVKNCKNLHLHFNHNGLAETYSMHIRIRKSRCFPLPSLPHSP